MSVFRHFTISCNYRYLPCWVRVDGRIRGWTPLLNFQPPLYFTSAPPQWVDQVPVVRVFWIVFRNKMHKTLHFYLKIQQIFSPKTPPPSGRPSPRPLNPVLFFCQLSVCFLVSNSELRKVTAAAGTLCRQLMFQLTVDDAHISDDNIVTWLSIQVIQQKTCGGHTRLAETVERLIWFTTGNSSCFETVKSHPND